jgi:TRAP-type mannitol/chloroaromatic compound transport system permease small subunit
MSRRPDGRNGFLLLWHENKAVINDTVPTTIRIIKINAANEKLQGSLHMTEKKGVMSRMTNAAAAVAGAAIIALLVMQIIVVILRYIFSYGIPWGLDLLVYLFLVESLLPLPLVILENHNIRVDIFYQGYSNEKKMRLDRFGLALLLFPSSAYAAYISWGPMLNSWRLHESSPTLDGLPGYFVLKTILFLTFVSISLVSFVLALKKQPWIYWNTSEKKA